MYHMKFHFFMVISKASLLGRFMHASLSHSVHYGSSKIEHERENRMT